MACPEYHPHPALTRLPPGPREQASTPKMFMTLCFLWVSFSIFTERDPKFPLKVLILKFAFKINSVLKASPVF